MTNVLIFQRSGGCGSIGSFFLYVHARARARARGALDVNKLPILPKTKITPNLSRLLAVGMIGGGSFSGRINPPGRLEFNVLARNIEMTRAQRRGGWVKSLERSITDDRLLSHSEVFFSIVGIFEAPSSQNLTKPAIGGVQTPLRADLFSHGEHRG